MGIRPNGLIIHPVDNLPDYHMFDFARIGSFSVSTKHVKYVMREDLLDHNGILDTAPSHFRLYMQERDIPRKKPPTPITYAYYAEPSHWPNARYYDVSRAYWQIARAFGAETYIDEGKTVQYGDTRFEDSLFDVSRVARGLLVSGTSERLSFDVWEGGEINTVSFPNGLYAPHLRSSIQYTLHAIIHMIKRYTIYANTDGFIVPSLYYKRVEDFLDNWNIKYKVKFEGDCVVKTRGTYRIGSHQTATFNMWKERRMDYVIESKPLWWLSKFQKGLEIIE